VLQLKLLDAQLENLGDPRTARAPLTIDLTSNGATTSFTLPTTGWSAVAYSGSHALFRWRDKTYAMGIGSIILDTRTGKVAVTGKGALMMPLAPTPSAVKVVLTTGASQFCTVFGGAIKKVSGRLFLAKYAPAPASC
jgi:hypothetical protein